MWSDSKSSGHKKFVHAESNGIKGSLSDNIYKTETNKQYLKKKWNGI